MTTIRTIVAGENFAGSALGRDSRLLTNRTGLVGEYLFGRDAATSVYNLADRSAPLTAQGTPIYHDRYVELGVGGYFGAGIGDSLELTLIVAFAVLTGAAGWLVTTYGQGSTCFTDFDLTANSVRALAGTTAGDAQGYTHAQFTAGTALSWSVATMRTHQVSGSSFQLQVDQWKGGVRLGGYSETVAQGRQVAPDPFCIGSAAGTNSAGSNIAIAGAAIIHGYRGDTAIAADYQDSLYPQLARWGISA